MVTVTAVGIGVAIGSFTATATWATVASVVVPLIVSTGIYIATAMLAPTSSSVSGPRLSDLRSVLSDNEGKPIPKVYGTARLSGTVIWSDAIREKRKKKTEHGQTTKTYTYYLNFAVGICEGPIVGVRKIWANNKIIYDEDATGEKQEDWLEFTTYKGTRSQEQDPLMVEYSEGLVPAYNGLAYVSFKDFYLADFGNRAPQTMEFEVVAYFENYYDTDPVGELTVSTFKAISTLLSPEIMDSAVYDSVSQIVTIGTVGFVAISYENSADVKSFKRQPMSILFDTSTGIPFKYVKNSKTKAFDFRSDYTNLGYEQPFIAASNGRSGSTFDFDFGVGMVARFNDKPNKRKLKVLFFRPSDGKQTKRVGVNSSYMPRFRLNKKYLVGQAYDLLTLTRGTELRIIDISKEGNTFSVNGLDSEAGHTLNLKACLYSYNPVKDSAILVYVTGSTTILKADIRVGRNDSNMVYVGTVAGPVYAHNLFAACMPVWADQTKASVRSIRFHNNEWWVLFNIYESGSSKVFTAIGKLDLDLTCTRVWVDDDNNPEGIFANTVDDFTIAGSYVYLYTAGVGSTQYNWLDTSNGYFYPYDLTSGINIDSVTFSSTDNSLIVMGATPAEVKLYKYVTGVIATDGSYTSGSNYGRRTSTTNVIKDICRRASIPENLLAFDTDSQVKGYTLASRMPARNAINPLLTAYYLSPVESNWLLNFRDLKAPDVISISNTDNFRARTSIQDGDIPIQEITLTEESSLPKSIDLSYIGNDYSFQKRVQSIKKEAGNLDHKSTLDYPLIMTDSEAANLAETLLYRAWIHKDTIKVYLPKKYSYIEPGDILKYTINNVIISISITNVEYQNIGIIVVEGHTEQLGTDGETGDVLIPGFDSDYTGSEASDPPEYIPIKGTMYFDVLNLPSILVMDQDSRYNSGFYFVARGNVEGWVGGSLFEYTGIEYVEIASTSEQTTFINILSGTFYKSRPYEYDLGSKLKVIVDKYQPALLTITDDEWVNGYNTIAIKTDDVVEIANFQTVELIAEGTYELSNFIRGRFGTEGNIREYNDSTIIYLLYKRPSDLGIYTRINKAVEDIGTYTYKGATFDKDINDYGDLEFEYKAATHLCYAPKIEKIIKELNGTYTITFRRRDRYRNKPLWLPFYSDVEDAPHKVSYSYTRGYTYETEIVNKGVDDLYTINFTSKVGGTNISITQKSDKFNDYVGKFGVVSTTQIDSIVDTASGGDVVTPPVMIYEFTDDIFSSTVISDSIGSHNGTITFPATKVEYKRYSNIYPKHRYVFTFTEGLYIQENVALSENNCSFWFQLGYNNKYIGTDPINIIQLPGDVSFELLPSTDKNDWVLNFVTPNINIPIIIEVEVGRLYHIAFTTEISASIYIDNVLEEDSLPGVTSNSSTMLFGDSAMTSGIEFILQDFVVYNTLTSDVIDFLYKTGFQDWNSIIYIDQKQEDDRTIE